MVLVDKVVIHVVVVVVAVLIKTISLLHLVLHMLKQQQVGIHQQVITVEMTELIHFLKMQVELLFAKVQEEKVG